MILRHESRIKRNRATLHWQTDNRSNRMPHKDDLSDDASSGDLSRRELVKLGLATALTASATAAAAGGVDVVETNVEVKMPDGTCDAAFIHPAKGAHPGVLIWPD